MKDLVRLAEQKGWNYEKEPIRLGIQEMYKLTVGANGEMQADTPDEVRVEIGYFTMRQIERWLMNKHDICISVNYVVKGSDRQFNYFIMYPDRGPDMTFGGLQAVYSYDNALYNALKIALKTLPDK
jgi:hypothetical protein